ncbi:MAG: dihydroneopterin triphosphate diphosphatase [Betaproteobacteria bacterium]
MSAIHKIPESVLVVIHTPALEVLLLERADHPGFGQSVTGSRASREEDLQDTARREVWEETGIDLPRERYTDWQLTQRYAIYPHWRHRYAPGVSHNTEHVYALALPDRADPRLAPREHRAWRWLPWREAADACFSWSNARAIRELPWRVRG